MHILEQLISTIAPHRCISCGVEGSPLCLPCTSQLPRPPECCYKCGKSGRHGLCRTCSPQSNLKTIHVRTVYQGLAEQAVRSLKFERNQAVAPILGQTMSELCPGGMGLIVHTPTANRRVRQRGYDQAELLARAMAAASTNPYRRLLLRRGKQRQLGQSRTVRQTQLETAFQVIATRLPHETPIILVDDVLTTGSTFEAAAAALRKAGFGTIHAVAFAWANGLALSHNNR